MDSIEKDDRFAHIIKDPKFRRIPKNERKVKIDKRFQSMFKDKKFTVNYTVDERGKSIIQSSGENLRKYYDLSDSEEVESETDSEEPKKISKKSESENQESSDEEKDDNSRKTVIKENEKQLHLKKQNENVNFSQNIKKKLRNMAVDYARGEGLLMSDSSSDEESSSESDNDEEINHDWGEFDKDAEETVESTRRLAACNMDWDNMRAVDLMVSLHSFLPSGGIIHSVTIYPSEFGMKRMKEEEINGPTELVNESSQELDEENEEGSSYHMEKLRQYQLNRLKYYYAVIVCDRSETADKLWSECRNMEYETSGIRYDLRFIPDDMEFDQTPKEVCDKLPDFSKYQPRIFTTTALQQEKVDLTWDETNVERKELTQKINSGKLDELNENHLKFLLASGSSEDESEGDKESNENQDDSDFEEKGNSIQKYKLLLKSIEESEETKKNDVELECTWGLNVKTEQQKSKSKIETLTPFEEYLEKRKEKRKAKRKSKTEEKGNQCNETSESEDDIPSDIDMNDSYFADELKNCKSKSKKTKKSQNKKISSDDEKNDELELVLMDKDEYEHKQHFNMKQIEENETASKSKKKRLKRKNKGSVDTQIDNFEVNVQDPRFDALFTSHHFNIDPADSHFRKTKATEALVNEKLKRRNTTVKTETKTNKQQYEKRMNPELSALVKSVKRKVNKNN